MSKLEQAENQVMELSQDELASFRAWFLEYDSDVWDQQIQVDVESGKLDQLAESALEHYHAGRSRLL